MRGSRIRSFPDAHIKDIVSYQTTLQEAIEGADIVTLHVPATKYNHHLFDQYTFNHFKKVQYLSIVHEAL